jgi:hypothetical protein
LLSQVFGNSTAHLSSPAKLARLKELCRLVVESFERLVQCQNRNIVFALLDRFWGMKEEALLHLEMIDHVQRGLALEEFSLIKYATPPLFHCIFVTFGQVLCTANVQRGLAQHLPQHHIDASFEWLFFSEPRRCPFPLHPLRPLSARAFSRRAPRWNVPNLPSHWRQWC